MIYRLLGNNRDRAIEDNVRKNREGTSVVVLICAARYLSGEFYPYAVQFMVYNLSGKPLTVGVLLSIPRRVCRARVSAVRPARGCEKLHRRITPEKNPRGLMLSVADKSISFNARNPPRVRHVGNSDSD